jgi:hypothetical protein
MQGIQWTERPTGALVVVGSLWPGGNNLTIGPASTETELER